MRTWLILLIAGLTWLAPQLARAQACAPGFPAGECFIEPTSAGQDVAPYCFIPTLWRGNSDTNYAVTANDPNGVCHHFQTFLRFDLPAGLLAPGQTVTHASLYVPYAFSFDIDGDPIPPTHPPAKLEVHRVTSNWTEAGVTWNTRPSIDGTAVAEVPGITTYQVLDIDVTQQVRRWAHGQQPNFGFALTSPSDRALGFYSWEAGASFPKVSLDIFTGPGVAPAPIPALPALWSAALVLAIATLFSSRLRGER